MSASPQSSVCGGFVGGEKLFQKRARVALPLLVRQAKARQPIFYSDLAKEMGMPNERNLDYVLGAIGDEMRNLSNAWKIEIPPIQCVVINKTHMMPGEGIGWFVEDRAAFLKSSREYKRRVVDRMLDRVYEFSRWDAVLKYFQLNPAPSLRNLATQDEMTKAASFGGGGESQAHKELKQFIARNPSLFGLSNSAGHGVIEHEFLSSDTIDVLFKTPSLIVGVEVKPSGCADSEIIRGMFQCIKYRALIEATCKVEQVRPDVRVILALGGSFPTDLQQMKNVLGIELVQRVQIEKKAAAGA